MTYFKELFLLVLFVVLIHTQNFCTEEDLRGAYSVCDPLTNTRSMSWYYDASNCIAEGLSTPSPVYDLPCYVECEGGYFLPWGGYECEACNAGSYSLGGGIQLDHFPSDSTWDDFSVASKLFINTYCSPGNSLIPFIDNAPCNGWRLNDYYADSGDLTDLNEVNSVLELSFRITQSYGQVEYDYMCDAENHVDGLRVQVDDGEILRLSNSAEFRTRITDYLGRGAHTLRFIYYKNPTNSVGEDIAKIDNIKINGVSLADDYCTKCSPGSVQALPGQQQCNLCDVGEFSSNYGGTECEQCGENEFSFIGSAECIDAQSNCTPDDYEELQTECSVVENNWQRTVHYAWKLPKICNSDNLSLPPNRTEPCGDCDPGFIKQSSGCIPCSEGKWSDGSKTSCESCNKGHAAIPIITYDFNIDHWPNNFYTGCSGDCSVDGWQIDEGFIEIPHPLGLKFDMFVSLITTITNGGGEVEFTFELSGGSVHSYLQFVIDGFSSAREYKQEDSSDKIRTEKFSLTPGQHQLTWNFHRFDVDDEYPNTGAKITKIVIRGAESGGAEECTKCKAGTFQDEDKKSYCKNCPPGSYSDENGAESCTGCGVGQYAKYPGSTECSTCATGLTSKRKSNYCYPKDCEFYSTDSNNVTHYFNLSPWQNTVPYVLNGDDLFPGVFIFGICDKIPNACNNDSFVCERYTHVNPNDPSSTYTQIGNFLSEFELIEVEEENDVRDVAGFTLKYTDGSSDGCPVGVSRTSSLTFNCHLNDENSQMVFDGEENCNYKFHIDSVFGCRVCTLDDFDRNEGQCEDNERTVIYTKKEGSICNGVVQDQIEDCETGNSINLGFVVVVILGGVVIFLVGAVIMLLIFLKNRKLQSKYSLLTAKMSQQDNFEDDNL